MSLVRGHWRSILPHFGVSPKILNGRNQPCPMCGGRDRFRFTDAEERGLYYCSGCGPGSGWDLACKISGKSKSEVRKEALVLIKGAPTPATPQSDEKASRRAMKELWEGAVTPSATSPVGLYLTRRLGRYWKSDAIRESRTTMVSRISDPSGRGVNLHLTYLTKDGQKADVEVQKKVMRGTLPEGCAIALWEAREIMGIAEGIETAMSAAILFKMPVWAAVSGVMLAKWQPPAIARKIVIFGDNDMNYTGQMRAYELAHRLSMKGGVEVDVRIPEHVGTDWNNVLMQA